MRNNLQRFQAPLVLVKKTLNELEEKGIDVKGIVINDAGMPSILVYNNEKLKILIKQKMTLMINVDYTTNERKDGSSSLYLDGCRLVWSNQFC